MGWQQRQQLSRQRRQWRQAASSGGTQAAFCHALDESFRSRRSARPAACSPADGTAGPGLPLAASLVPHL